jgi:hypothetical protein
MNTITPNQLSALSGYSPQRIRQFQVDGILPKTISRGKLPADSALAALFAHMRGKLEKYTDSRASAQNREQQANASLAEIKLHKEIGNLCMTTVVIDWVNDLIVTIREALLHSKELPRGVAEKLLHTIHDIQSGKTKEANFTAICPRCRKSIWDDLDNDNQPPTTKKKK